MNRSGSEQMAGDVSTNGRLFGFCARNQDTCHRFCARARKGGSHALRSRWQRGLAKGRRVKGCGIMREEVGLPSVVAWAGCFRRRRRIRRRYAP